MWIAVSPMSIEDDIKVDKNSEETVSVFVRDQFTFPSNVGCKVKISKWTGRDAVDNLMVKPQVIALKEENKMEMKIENPYYDRTLKLQKYDKIGCLSILSTPVPRDARNLSPERFQTSDNRWFRMTHAVLHRKGQLDVIKVYPGKVMRIMATLKGSIKKYVGLEVLVSEIDRKICPIEPQVCRILDYDCIGFNVRNCTQEVIEIDKRGQNVAYISVWANMAINEDLIRK